MPHKVTLTPSFKKRLTKKDHSKQGAILECIKRLADDPTHPGLQTRRIRGTKKIWEARIDHSNRLSWEYGEKGEIICINHCSHQEVLP